MDQKIRNAGSNMTGVIAIFCGFITLPLGVAFLVSRPAEIWWLGIILLPTSVFLIYTGIKTLHQAREEKIETENIEKNIFNKIAEAQSRNNKGSNETSPEIKILAHWQYSPEEWNRFLQMEKKDRKMDLWIEIILIIILGAVLVKFSRSATWLGAFAASVPIAFLIAVLRYKFNLFSISPSGKKNAEVIITDDALIVNGHYNRLSGKNLWMKNVVVKKLKEIEVLEITYSWNTRGGETSEEIRVPVPNGKMAEALEVEKKLLEKNGIKN